MSCKAMIWAAKQSLPGLTKCVLLMLANFQSREGLCCPSQATLAAAAGVSRSALNEHLTELERRGLIRRDASTDPKTGGRRSTRYFLAVDAETAPAASGRVGRGRRGMSAGRTGAARVGYVRQGDLGHVRPADTNLKKEGTIYAHAREGAVSPPSGSVERPERATASAVDCLEQGKRERLALALSGQRVAVPSTWATPERLNAMVAVGQVTAAQAAFCLNRSGITQPRVT